MGVIPPPRSVAGGRLAELAHDQTSLALTALSRLLGWIYTFAWSASFYPQVIHNHRHKSTVGLSTDFVVLNAVGHASYFAYNSLLFFYEPVRRAYRRQHEGRDNVVQLNDWVFSFHATLLALVTLLQYLAYKKAQQGVSRTVRLAMAAALTAGVFLVGAKRLKLVGWIQIVNACSTLKLAITLTKYLPQIKLNADRKSTDGFSIENILLDLTGGILSLLQLILDAVAIQGSWSGVTGDWGKLGLSLLSIAFDAILIWQHYVAYPSTHNDEADSEEEQDAATQDAGHVNTGSAYGSTEAHAASSSARPHRDRDEPTESTSLLR